jgi:hypothetical protein
LPGNGSHSAASAFNGFCASLLPTGDSCKADPWRQLPHIPGRISSSQSHVRTDGPSASQSWCQELSGAQDQILVRIYCHGNQLSHVVYRPVHSSGWLLLLNHTVIILVSLYFIHSLDMIMNQRFLIYCFDMEPVIRWLGTKGRSNRRCETQPFFDSLSSHNKRHESGSKCVLT